MIYHTPLYSVQDGQAQRATSLRISQVLSILFPIDFSLILYSARSTLLAPTDDLQQWFRILCKKYEFQMLIICRLFDGSYAVDAFVCPAVITTDAFFAGVRKQAAFPKELMQCSVVSSGDQLSLDRWPYSFLFCSDEHVVHSGRDPKFFWKQLMEPLKSTVLKKYSAELTISWTDSVIKTVDASSLEEARKLLDNAVQEMCDNAEASFDPEQLEYNVGTISQEA